MLKHKMMSAGLIAAVLTGAGGAGIAYASSQSRGVEEGGEGPEGTEASDEQREAQILAGARASLASAVQVAETRTGLKASEAGINDEGGQPMFEVSLGYGGQERTALIDTQTGQIVKIVAETKDGEGDED